jgi:hypothetical protein
MTIPDMIAADAALAERMGDLNAMVLECASGSLVNVWHSLRDGYTSCRRGVYHAEFLGYHRTPRVKVEMVAQGSNRPANNLRPRCWPDNQHLCIRDRIGVPTGVAYDNCPAVHALESLPFPLALGWSWDGFVWLEMGGSMPGTPAAKWLHLGPEDVYPCLRCLSRAAWMGVEALAWINADGERPEVRWVDVASHARVLMARGTA